MISQKIIEIRANIKEICAETGHNPQDIALVGVTKYTDVSSMEQAIAAGVTDIAENKVQDAKKKFLVFEDRGVKFKKHMIGHLQTNKAKDAVLLFDMIQSVDSLKVAKEIDKQAAKINKVMDVLVQVNSSGEKQKSGVDLDKAIDLIREISMLSSIQVLGLMTIGLMTDDRDEIVKCFQKTKTVFDEAAQVFEGYSVVEMKYLSMGMTQDYEVAIACGANMVRIGSAIFS